jgi:hypothetical protein
MEAKKSPIFSLPLHTTIMSKEMTHNPLHGTD